MKTKRGEYEAFLNSGVKYEVKCKKDKNCRYTPYYKIKKRKRKNKSADKELVKV